MIRDRAFMRIASHREAGSTATFCLSRKAYTVYRNLRGAPTDAAAPASPCKGLCMLRESG